MTGAAVFLDRDNTLIANDDDLGDPERVRLLDGVTSGLLALGEAGYRLIVITNQGGVARGVFTESDVHAVHERITALLERETGGRHLIDRFYYCPYHPDGVVERYRREHPWRKPRPGMLLQAAQDMHLDLATSWTIGDQPRDIRAGQEAGCRTVLIGVDDDDARPTATATGFAEAVQHVLRHTAPRQPRRSGDEETDPLPDTPPSTGAPKALRSVAEIESKPASTAVAEPIDTLRLVTPLDGDAETSASEAETAVARQAETDQEPPPPESREDSTLRRVLGDLVDELRSQRQRRTEFTAIRMACGICQVGVVMLAIFGLVQLDDTQAFTKWFLGACLLQLLTITLLLADAKG